MNCQIKEWYSSFEQAFKVEGLPCFLYLVTLTSKYEAILRVHTSLKREWAQCVHWVHLKNKWNVLYALAFY